MLGALGSCFMYSHVLCSVVFLLIKIVPPPRECWAVCWEVEQELHATPPFLSKMFFLYILVLRD